MSDVIGVPKWLVALVAGAMLTLTLSASGALIALASRVTVMEVEMDIVKTTRFTDAMGADLESRMRAYHDTRTPPPEVTQRLMEHERRLEQQSGRLLRLEQGGGTP